MNIGYEKCCSHSCASTLYRKELKEDKDRFTKFSNKVKQNMINIHKNKSLKEKIELHTKIGNTISKKCKLLSKEELKDRFGWMNKLTKSELDIFLNNVMFNTGMFKWWKNATESQKKKIYKQRAKTCAITWAQKSDVEINEIMNKSLKSTRGFIDIEDENKLLRLYPILTLTEKSINALNKRFNI